MKILKRRTELERLEADLAGKRDQRQRLADRLATAQAELDRARMLVTELAPQDGVEARLDSAERDVRTKLDRVGTLSAAVSTIEGEIAETGKGLAAERDKAQRQQSVAELHRLLADVDAALPAWLEATGKLATALEVVSHRLVYRQGSVQAAQLKQQIKDFSRDSGGALHDLRLGVSRQITHLEAASAPKVEKPPPEPERRVLTAIYQGPAW